MQVTQLIQVVEQNNLAKVKEILATGEVDVNVFPDGEDGKNALHIAAEKGFMQIIRELLLAGAKINLPDKTIGNTALHWACYYAACFAYHVSPVDFSIPNFLIKEGADLLVLNNSNKSPLVFFPAECQRQFLKDLNVEHNIEKYQSILEPLTKLPFLSTKKEQMDAISKNKIFGEKRLAALKDSMNQKNWDKAKRLLRNDDSTIVHYVVRNGITPPDLVAPIIDGDYDLALQRAVFYGRKDLEGRLAKYKAVKEAASKSSSSSSSSSSSLSSSPSTPEKTYHLAATQGGIVRYLNGITPTNITGLYTDNLQTCATIIICGEKGVTLIHDTGLLRLQDIIEEFKIIGKVKFWTVAYNPDFKSADDIDTNVIQPCTDKLRAIGIEIPCEIPDFSYKSYCCDEGFVTISTDGHISGLFRPTRYLAAKNIKSNEMHKRYFINHLNEIFNEQYMQRVTVADVQFDGKDFTQMPTIHKTPLEMFALLQKYWGEPLWNDNPNYKDIYKLNLHLLLFYTRQYVPECCDALQGKISGDGLAFHKKLLEKSDAYYKCMMKYKTPDHACAIRRAAHEGNVDDLAYLLEFKYFLPTTRDTLNARGSESGDTALHVAVRNNKIEAARLLLKNGAKDVKNAAGETASNLAQQLGKNEMIDLFETTSSNYRLSMQGVFL